MNCINSLILAQHHKRVSKRGVNSSSNILPLLLLGGKGIGGAINKIVVTLIQEVNSGRRPFLYHCLDTSFPKEISEGVVIIAAETDVLSYLGVD